MHIGMIEHICPDKHPNPTYPRIGKKNNEDFQSVLDAEMKKMESKPTKVSDSISTRVY